MISIFFLGLCHGDAAPQYTELASFLNASLDTGDWEPAAGGASVSEQTTEDDTLLAGVAGAGSCGPEANDGDPAAVAEAGFANELGDTH